MSSEIKSDNLSIDSSSTSPSSPPSTTTKKKTTPRPSMQIYKPPGLRNSGSTPTFSSANQQSSTSSMKTKEKSSSEDSTSQQENPRTSFTPDNKYNRGNKNYQEYSKNNQQQQKLKSSNQQTTSTDTKSISRTLSSVIKDTRKKPLIQKDIDDIITTFKKLDIIKEKKLINDFILSNMESDNIAKNLGQYLVQYAIEENKTNGRTVARLCASLLECPSGVAFHQGLLTSILQYYDCRDQLRVDHLRVWIGFLNFISDLYAHVGFTYEGEMVEVIFNIFDYMLKKPVLETLKIEELECMIASLLSVGYDLERQCPDDLGRLKNQIRDAFIEVQEPWARKMILLLMELSASGWTLPSDSNEYYFG